VCEKPALPVSVKALLEILFLFDHLPATNRDILLLLESAGYPEHAAKVRSLIQMYYFQDAKFYVQNLLLQLRPLKLQQLRKKIEHSQLNLSNKDSVILVFAEERNYSEFRSSFQPHQLVESQQSLRSSRERNATAFLENFAIQQDLNTAQVYNLSKLVKDYCFIEEDVAGINCIYRIVKDAPSVVPMIILSNEFWIDYKFSKFIAEFSLQLSLLVPVEVWCDRMTVIIPPSVYQVCQDGTCQLYEGSKLYTFLSGQTDLAFPIRSKGYSIVLRMKNLFLLPIGILFYSKNFDHH
jgi:hypothetical protein